MSASHTETGHEQTYLNNFLARINAPSDGVWPLAVRVCPQVALLVHGIISDPGIALNASDERGKEFRRNEEFEVCLVSLQHSYKHSRSSAHLLVYISTRWSPPMNLIIATYPIDSRLRVYRKVSQLIHSRQLICDDGCFGCRWLR